MTIMAPTLHIAKLICEKLQYPTRLCRLATPQNDGMSKLRGLDGEVVYISYDGEHLLSHHERQEYYHMMEYVSELDKLDRITAMHLDKNFV